MKTYFVTSDIHGYYAIWMNALTKAGFDVANPDHILIVLGDIFDRGEEGPKVYDFLRLLPKERRILVKGNHEELLLELLERGYPLMRDEHNCTDKTLEQFAYGYESLKQKGLAAARDMSLSWEERSRLWNHYDDLMQKRLYKGKAIQQVAKWIQSDEWVDYYETPHFVFVHAWVPMRGDEYYCEYDPNWRKASSSAWYQARWRCPYRMFLSHFWDEECKKGKTLVCGHWHTSDFYNHMDYVDKPECRLDYRVNNPIYQSQDFPGLIGIDACTALTHECNVLVLNEGEL